MARLPQIRRLLVEDFISQKEWIAKLFQPINGFMEGVASVFDRNISIKDNMAADLITITLEKVPTVADPFPVKWSLGARPMSVHVGNVVKTDNTALTLTAGVFVQWAYDANNGLRLTNIVGVTPSSTTKYNLTLVIFTG